MFIVTCLHVLPKPGQAHEITFSFQNSSTVEKSKIDFKVPIYDQLGNFVEIVKADANGNDVVAIEVTDVFLKNKESLNFLQEIILPYEMLTITDSVHKYNIDVGSDIFFIGYPALFYDKRNSRPILRTGVISSDPYDDFYYSDILKEFYLKIFGERLPEKFNGFLIDANSTAGSSGSLVFSKKTDQYLDPVSKNMIVGQPIPNYILGIVDLSFNDIDSRTIANRIDIHKQPTQLGTTPVNKGRYVINWTKNKFRSRYFKQDNKKYD